MVVAVHVEITGSLQEPSGQGGITVGRVAMGPQKQTGQNIKEISTESSHTLM